MRVSRSSSVKSIMRVVYSPHPKRTPHVLAPTPHLPLPPRNRSSAKYFHSLIQSSQGCSPQTPTPHISAAPNFQRLHGSACNLRSAWIVNLRHINSRQTHPVLKVCGETGGVMCGLSGVRRCAIQTIPQFIFPLSDLGNGMVVGRYICYEGERQYICIVQYSVRLLLASRLRLW
jgi:hypothetical protein